MKRIVFIIGLVMVQLSALCGNDSTKVHISIEAQLNTGYYYSKCVDDPPNEFMGNYITLKGIQLSPGAGISLDWKWFGLGLTFSIINRINLNENDQSTAGLGIMGHFDLATWNSPVPVGLRIYGGILPLGFRPTDHAEDQSTIAVYSIGFAPVVRLNKRSCRTTFLLAPAAEYTFGQYWNREATGGSSYSGKYTVHYTYVYNSISLSLMLIIKFRTPQHRARQQRPTEMRTPVPPVPPFPPFRH